MAVEDQIGYLIQQLGKMTNDISEIRQRVELLDPNAFQSLEDRFLQISTVVNMQRQIDELGTNMDFIKDLLRNIVEKGDESAS